MKRICFFSGDITKSGGTEKVACQIANMLYGRYDVRIVSLTEENTEMFYELDRKIEHFALFKSNPDGIKQFRGIVTRLGRFIKKSNIDILIDIDTVLDMFAVPAVAFSKTKLISWEHFNFYESMGNKLRIPIRKYVTRFSDCVVTLTKEDRDNYKGYFGDKHRIEQIYNPIEFENEGHTYDVGSKTIVSAGRLSRQKGFDILLQVAEKVFRSHPDWEWLILGEGEDRDKLERTIEENNIRSVKLMGRVGNVSEYMKKASIYVMTSRYEGFPLVLIEAKANLLPVVSFSCKTGPAELVQDGINGYLVDCFDVDSMAEKIDELIDDPQKRIKFSSNALFDTEKIYGEYIKKQWVKLIEGV